jgi:hypothetical protein
MAGQARAPWFLGVFVGLSAACGGGSSAPTPAVAPPPATAATPPLAPSSPTSGEKLATGEHAEHPKHPDLLAYARAHLPAGGEATMEDGHLVLTHHLAKNDSASKIAAAWLELSDVYAKDDLAKAIAHANPQLATHKFAEGDPLKIPSPITEAPAAADDERIGWPADKSIRGIYMHDDGYYGGVNWVPTLDRLKARGMNAIVLDFKDYDGRFTYDTKLPLALETHASIHHIPDMARAIRFAHARGIRILGRIACFHDPWTAPKKTELSIMGNWGGPFPGGWLDPGNAKAHTYITDIVKEVLTYGVDEVQLDYVRYPVHAAMNKADFKLGTRTRIEVIRDFVREVHALTAAKKVPLSLDVFGVTAMAYRPDIEALGQDLAVLAPECEALSPMVYPSHYDKGFMGWDEPGNHPEIIAIGVKGSLAQIEAGKVEHPALIRPWLQAFHWRSPEYGPKYLAEETRQAVAGGGIGWLMWNPGQAYGDAWKGLPPIEPKPEAPAPVATPSPPGGTGRHIDPT